MNVLHPLGPSQGNHHIPPPCDVIRPLSSVPYIKDPLGITVEGLQQLAALCSACCSPQNKYLGLVSGSS